MEIPSLGTIYSRRSSKQDLYFFIVYDDYISDINYSNYGNLNCTMMGYETDLDGNTIFKLKMPVVCNSLEEAERFHIKFKASYNINWQQDHTKSDLDLMTASEEGHFYSAEREIKSGANPYCFRNMAFIKAYNSSYWAVLDVLLGLPINEYYINRAEHKRNLFNKYGID